MSAMRREPSQERSRARVAQILEAAAALLAEGGPEALKPTAVARAAEVPVGSVYQYFSGKDALLGALLERYQDRARQMLDEHLAGCESLEALRDGLEKTSRSWFAMHREEPLWRHVFAGLLGSSELQQRDLADTRASAARIAAAILAVAPDADAGAVERSSLLINHLFIAAMQLALAEPTAEAQEALFESWLAMAGGELARVLEGSSD